MSENRDKLVAGLRPDVVIEDVGPTGRALNISEMLSIRTWFNARMKSLNPKQER